MSNVLLAAAVLTLVVVATVGYGLYSGQAPTATTTSTVTTSPTATQTITIVRTSSQTFTIGSTVTVTSTTMSTTSVTTTATVTMTIPVTITVTSTQSSISVSQVAVVLGAGSDTSSNGYAPANLVVVLGRNNTVLWVNNDRVAHTISSSSSSEPFNSGNMDPGKTYTYTFTKPGTYQYFCSYHGWMHGTVTVKA